MQPDEIRQFHEGAPNVFARLFETIAPEVRQKIGRMAGVDGDIIDDLLQETILRAYEHRRGFRGDGPPVAWVMRICDRVCADFIRRERRQKRRRRDLEAALSTGSARGVEQDSSQDALSRQGYLERVTDAVVSLPPRKRAIVIARWYLDWKAPRIAQTFGVTVPTVWTTLSQALACIRTRLDTAGSDD